MAYFLLFTQSQLRPSLITFEFRKNDSINYHLTSPISAKVKRPAKHTYWYIEFPQIPDNNMNNHIYKIVQMTCVACGQYFSAHFNLPTLSRIPIWRLAASVQIEGKRQSHTTYIYIYIKSKRQSTAFYILYYQTFLRRFGV